MSRFTPSFPIHPGWRYRDCQRWSYIMESQSTASREYPFLFFQERVILFKLRLHTNFVFTLVDCETEFFEAAEWRRFCRLIFLPSSPRETPYHIALPVSTVRTRATSCIHFYSYALLQTQISTLEDTQRNTRTLTPSYRYLFTPIHTYIHSGR